MTVQIALLLFIIGVAVALFSLERLPADVIALGVLSTLILTGLLPPGQAFASFGSDTVIMIGGLLILTAALVRTGVVDIVGRALLRLTGDNPNRLLMTIMVTAATLSAFMSNTASTAFFVPITLSLARRVRISAAKLLMPLAFSTILASSVTLVSSSTNIVISGLMTHYDLPPLGMGETILHEISQTTLRIGDQLLIQGRRARIAVLEEENTFRILGAVDYKRPNLQRAPLAITIFAGVLAVAAFNFLSLPVAVLLGTLLAFTTRCITPDEAYREVNWKALILIGSTLAVGSALDYTGTAKFLAAQIANVTDHAHPIWLLTAFFALTMLFTQPLSNQAAAVIVLPIALQTALQLDLNPRTFAIMIAVAASCSYVTPLEPACLMVYGPGSYRFMDFVKVGSLLTALTYILTIVLVPLIWPL